jgi:hypothetical protein
MCFFAALAIAACHEDDGPYVDTDAATQSTGGDASSEGEATTGDAPWSSLDERECPEDSILTWENFGGPYVLSYCTTCHHSALPADERQRAPVGVNLETVELMRSQADRVWVRGADQNATMPPVGAPSADDRALLGEWLACGAPTQADL